MPRNANKQTRRGNMEGSIYQRADGKWCGQVTVGYNALGKPVRKTFYGGTRTEVAKKVSEATHQVFSGNLTIPGARLTLETLITNFLWTFKKPTVSDVTFEWYLGTAKTHIIPAFGSVMASDLTTYQIQNLINSLHSEKHRSERTIKCVRDILNQAYKHAIELRQLSTNPVAGTKLPKKSRFKDDERESVKIIPVADRTAILQAAEGDLRMKTAITVLMFTGIRIGEFLALTWGNVDFESGVIHIDRAITFSCEYHPDGRLKSRKTVVGDTKTQCGRRKFKAAPVVLDVLKQWRAALPSHVRSSVTRDLLADNAVVFPNDLGEMRTYDGFRTTYRRFMSENRLGDYTIHSYRHAFATMLLERGVNPRVVQKLLGHRDIETTLGIYSHVLPEVVESVADTMDALHAELFQKNTTLSIPTAAIG